MPSMSASSQQSHRRVEQFFLIALAHENLHSYYKMNFALMQHHKYKLSDIEQMIPYEREVYVTMLLKFLDDQNNKK